MSAAPVQALLREVRLRPEVTASIFCEGARIYRRLARDSQRITHEIAATFRSAAAVIVVVLTIHACPAESQTITVERGVPFPLVLAVPFDIFLLGNPDVVDVHSRTDRSVIVEGLAP